MSIRAIAWALTAKTGSPTAKLVLIKLADNANDAGVCWPSLAHIAEHTELSERAIRSHLRALEGLHLIRVERRHSEGVQLPNVYHLEIPKTVGVGHDVPGGGAGGAPGVGHDVPGNINRQREPSLEPQTPSLALGGIEPFEEFWESFGYKVGRKEAEQAYGRALKKIPHRQLVEAAKSYAKACQFRPKDKWKHPSSWLNAERWADEMPGVPAPKQDFAAMVRQVFSKESRGEAERLVKCFELTYGTNLQAASNRLADFAAAADPMIAANNWFFAHGGDGCMCGVQMR